MPVVDVRGLSFHVQECGEGPAVFLLHGLLLGNLASWLFTTAPALARTRRAVLHDLRGHGMSERVATGYGVSEMSADLAALHDSLAPGERIDLVGHSYGALVSLRYALDHPERVRRLVLVEAPLPPSLLQDELARLAGTDPSTLIAGVPKELADRLLGSVRRRLKAAGTVRYLLEETSLTADVAAEPDVPDEVLASLSCPTLCAYGSRSSCRPVGDRLAAALPNARLLELDGSHYLPVERPDELTAAVVEFLDG